MIALKCPFTNAGCGSPIKQLSNNTDATLVPGVVLYYFKPVDTVFFDIQDDLPTVTQLYASLQKVTKSRDLGTDMSRV